MGGRERGIIDAPVIVADDWANTLGTERGAIFRDGVREHTSEITEQLIHEEEKEPAEAPPESQCAIDIPYYAQKPFNFGDTGKDGSGATRRISIRKETLGFVELAKPERLPNRVSHSEAGRLNTVFAVFRLLPDRLRVPLPVLCAAFPVADLAGVGFHRCEPVCG